MIVMRRLGVRFVSRDYMEEEITQEKSRDETFEIKIKYNSSQMLSMTSKNSRLSENYLKIAY